MILLGLIPGFLYAASNFIDKYLLHKYGNGDDNIRTLILTSAMLNIILLPFLFMLTHRNAVATIDRFVLIGSGILYIVSLIPYFYALRESDASLTSLYLQMIPIFNLLGGYFFFNEILTSSQRIGVVLLFGATIIAGIQKKEQTTFSWKTFGLMTLCSLLFATVGIVFKWMNVGTYSFRATTSREYLGAGIVGLLLFSIPIARKHRRKMFRHNSIGYTRLNTINELTYITATKTLQYAQVVGFIGIATLINNGSQPIFGFLLGIILTLTFPKIFTEDLSRFALIQKLTAIIITCIGIWLLA